MLFATPYLLVFAVSAIATFLAISLGATLLSHRRTDHIAIQCSHVEPTPRIGGIAIAIGVVLSTFLVPVDVRPMYLLVVTSTLPVFLAGLLEDLGYHVTPKFRLLAGVFASAIAVALLQEYWVKSLDIPGVDHLMAFAPIGIGFTIFATAGVSHAFNLIDGLNGLSAGTASLSALGLAGLGLLSGNLVIVPLCLMLLAALMGFLIFNYPWGRIFLGDAGAYSVGHLLVWLSILLLCMSSQITPWAIVLIFFWPLADTLFTIQRRLTKGMAFDQPDRLHMHQMVMRALEIGLLGKRQRRKSNPLATLCMMPLISFPIVLGLIFWNDPVAAFGALLFSNALFVFTYFSLGHLARRRFRRIPAATLQRRAQPVAGSDTRSPLPF